MLGVEAKEVRNEKKKNVEKLNECAYSLSFPLACLPLCGRVFSQSVPGVCAHQEGDVYACQLKINHSITNFFL